MSNPQPNPRSGGTTVPVTRIDTEPPHEPGTLTMMVLRSATFLVIREPDGTWRHYDLDREDWDTLMTASAAQRALFAAEKAPAPNPPG